MVTDIEKLYNYKRFLTDMIFTFWSYSLDAGRKFNVDKMFRSYPGHLLNLLCTFKLRPVSRGYCQWKYLKTDLNCSTAKIKQAYKHPNFRFPQIIKKLIYSFRKLPEWNCDLGEIDSRFQSGKLALSENTLSRHLEMRRLLEIWP